MPFKKVEGNVIWEPPVDDELKKTEEEIRKASSAQEVVLVTNTPPPPGDQVVVEDPTKFIGINRSLRSSIDMMLDKGIGPVDIIIPIYNAIHIASKCIETVLTRTRWPYRLIIVNDCSDSFTQKWLDKQGWPDHVTVLHNNKNRGFSATVNRGIKTGMNPYICVLNSDVLVTDRWITKMVMALEANKRNVIVNPITNNTAEINVGMQQGADYIAMNNAFESTSQHAYPEIMPTGFCFFFRRDLLKEVGFFDEGYTSYGEETDFWMKSITFLSNGYYKKYRAVLADDTYLFHERGTSFSVFGESEHMDIRKTGNQRFHRLWPQYGLWRSTHDPKKIMAPYRKNFSRRVIHKVGSDYKICWVVRSTAMCGGMKYIADIVNEINERGGDARVALVRRTPNSPDRILPELRCMPIMFDSDQDFIENFSRKVFKKGVVVAAISELAHLVGMLCKENEALIGVNHVQSYDPFIAENEDQLKLANSSFSVLPHVITNSEWISNKLISDHGVTPLATVHPGIDRKLFYPKTRSSGDDRATVLISLNKSYTFKGYNRGIHLAYYLSEMAMKNSVELRVMAYGIDSCLEVPAIIGLGEISQVRLANILGNEVDIFVEPSEYHSYGLPALEAMGCGVPVVCWDNTGIHEYGKDGENCIILPKDTEVSDAAVRIFKLLSEAETRKNLALNGLKTVESHSREESVNSFIRSLERKLSISYPKRKIVFVTPHLRKHGGPTTIIHAANELYKRGHDVSISCVYSDINPEVTVMSMVPINVNINNIPECDALIVNSDSDISEQLHALPQAKHKILFKMSHNERFKVLEENSLNLKWDRILTTTKWLADACKTPMGGWNHPPVKNVARVGWYHYSHDKFNCIPGNRKYGSKATSFIVGTLIHQHPLKGTEDALKVLDRLRRKYPLEVIGVGEVPPNNISVPDWVNYQFKPNRNRMSDIMKQMDVWVGASKTEGLGRLALEAMSASVACVLSDTKPEFADHPNNCLLYPKGNLLKLERRLEYLFENPDKFKEICLNANATAKKFSDPEFFVDSLERMISEVCDV